MTKPEQLKSTQEFGQYCVDVLKRMRAQTYEVLDKAGTVHKAQPLKQWKRILRMKSRDYIEFDSARDPRLVAITRPVAKDSVIPRIRVIAPVKLSEIPAMEVRLSGIPPKTRSSVDIMSVYFPKGSDDITRTTVMLWAAPFPLSGENTFYGAMNSQYGYLIDLTTTTLENINDFLKKR